MYSNSSIPKPKIKNLDWQKSLKYCAIKLAFLASTSAKRHLHKFWNMTKQSSPLSLPQAKDCRSPSSKNMTNTIRLNPSAPPAIIKIHSNPMPTIHENIFLFYGEDTYSSSQKLKHWKSEFVRKYGDETNLEVIEGADLDTSVFNTNLEAMPFLAEKRMIIIKDFLSKGSSDNQKRVAENLENTPEFVILIFHENEMPDRRTSLFQKLSKIAKPVEFETLSARDTTNWIMERARAKNQMLSPMAANYLIEYCGLDLWHLSSEMDKLHSYTNGKAIDQKIIEEVCVPSVGSSIFKLTDAIATKNTKESLKIFKTLILSGEEIGRIFFMVVRHFRILMQVKDLLEKHESPSSITKRLGQHPFVIQTTSKQAGNFSEDQLKKIYGRLLSIDIAAKTGQIKAYGGETKEFELALERLIIDYCK